MSLLVEVRTLLTFDARKTDYRARNLGPFNLNQLWLYTLPPNAALASYTVTDGVTVYVDIELL